MARAETSPRDDPDRARSPGGRRGGLRCGRIGFGELALDGPIAADGLVAWYSMDALRGALAVPEEPGRPVLERSHARGVLVRG